MAYDRTAFIGVEDFAEHTDGELGRALDTLAQQGMRQVVIDLRNDPGGLRAGVRHHAGGEGQVPWNICARVPGNRIGLA